MYNNRPPVFNTELNSYKESYEDKLKEVETKVLTQRLISFKARLKRYNYEKSPLTWRAYNIVRQVLERRYYLC
jgi:hypothetical protein